MSRPDPTPSSSPPADTSSPPAPPGAPTGIPGPQGSRYGWFVGLLVVLIIAYITLNTIRTGSNNGASGVAVGRQLPPFAAPLALSALNGDANIATGAHQGSRGSRPACAVRGPQILNACALFERGPVVLALFVASGSCPAVVDDLQRLSGSFPGVQFAAVAIRGDRGHLRSVIRAHHWALPVGYDHDGAVANLYRVSTCPQVAFAYPGGTVAERALLTRPAPSVLRARVAELVAGSRARGWSPSA